VKNFNDTLIGAFVIKKLQSFNGRQISARNFLMCFEVITIRLGLSEDGVNRRRSR